MGDSGRHLCLTNSTTSSSDAVITRAQPSQEDLFMLVELSMVEQRYDAVREVLDGAMR
jgi:hypothetical protein